MKSIRRILGGLVLAGLLATSQNGFGQAAASTQTDFSSINVSLESATDVQAMLEALATVPPVPFDSLPRNKFNRVNAIGFWSMQNPNWPALPGNFYNLDVWPLGDGAFVIDDRKINYDEIQAEADAEAALTELVSPKLTMRSSMMAMSLASSYAYGNPVYLTNLVVSAGGSPPITASFSIAGGTNFVPFDIWMTTNLLNKISQSQWTWLGIAYTSNRYTFTNQPADMAFYALASPQRTMTIAWGANSSGQCNVPTGLSNAMTVVGGANHSIALLNNSNLVAWGDNTYGQTNIPAGLTNAVVITANGYHNLALRADGTVSIWGDWLVANNYYGVTLPTGLTNIVAVAAGWNHDLVVRSNGTVVAWSYYTTTPYTVVPTNLPPAKDVAAGQSHSVALLTNGTVVVWGENYDNLGWDVTNTPAGLSNVAAIAAGDYHTLALKSDGTVVAWGAGDSFTFADQGQSTVPAGLSNVVAIAADGYHSIALKKDGTVVVWGDMTTPGFSLNQIFGIGSGWDHALALRTGNSAPLITSQPVSQSTQPGQTVTFSVQAIGLAALQYQWQFNGVVITNSTNSTLVLTNVDPLQQGYYQVVVFGGGGSIASTNAMLRMLPSNVTNLTVAGTNWIQGNVVLTVPSSVLTNLSGALQFQWLHDGVPIPGAIYTNYGVWFFPAEAASWKGDYSVNVTSASGTTNIGIWRIYYLQSGGVTGWGNDDYGQLDRPAGLANAAVIATGEFHSVAVKDDGSVVQWGYDWGDVPVNLTNAVTVAAGYEHSIAVRADGTVVTWGYSNSVANVVPANLSGVKAVAAGWEHNVALLTNGTMTAWGDNYYGQTNVPAGLTNVTAVSACSFHSLALKGDGTVVGWGYNYEDEIIAPAGLSNVVAIATGFEHSLALKANGTVVAWGDNSVGQCNVPAGLSNVMAIAAGWWHSVALKNDGTAVSWGDNSAGQTNATGWNQVKLIAAAGNHTIAGVFSPLMQYPVDVTKDLLLIYNTNSVDSTTVFNYYLAHRPMVSGANVLGIGYTNAASPGYYETITPTDLTNQIFNLVQIWLTNNPTKRPQYVILFMDLPSRVNDSSAFPTINTNVNAGSYPTSGVHPSVSVQFQSIVTGWQPFTTHLNMGMTNTVNRTNDCIGYINKLAAIGTTNSFGSPIISASAGGYANTNYAIDNIYYTGQGLDGSSAVFSATNGLLAAGVSSQSITFISGIESNSVLPHIAQATNLAGYISWGAHSSLNRWYAIDGSVKWHGNSGWYLIETIESHNGQQYSDMGNFIYWYSGNAFGGTNYSNTPIGAVSYVDEPGLDGVNDSSAYFGLWANGKNFGICAWNSRKISLFYQPAFQAVGDPFITK